jgi:hypothetical protein
MSKVLPQVLFMTGLPLARIYVSAHAIFMAYLRIAFHPDYVLYRYAPDVFTINQGCYMFYEAGYCDSRIVGQFCQNYRNRIVRVYPYISLFRDRTRNRNCGRPYSSESALTITLNETSDR